MRQNVVRTRVRLINHLLNLTWEWACTSALAEAFPSTAAQDSCTGAAKHIGLLPCLKILGTHRATALP